MREYRASDSGSAQERINLGETHLKTYVAALAALAVTLAASWVYTYGFTYEPRLVVGAVVLAGLVLLGDLYSVQITEQSAIGAWDIVLMVAVVALGPTWAALAAVPSALLVGRRDALRTVYELGHSVTIVFLAGTVFSFVAEPLLIGDPKPPATVLYGALVSGTTLAAASEIINGVTYKVKHGRPFGETWREVVQPYLLSDVVNVLTAGLGVLALVVYGPVAAVVAVAGSIGSQVLVYRSREQLKSIRELKERNRSLEEALTTSNLAFGTMIMNELGSKDGYTHRHAAATAAYAADLAREMRLDGSRVERLRIAGLLHNVGLFGLPEELLLAAARPNSIAQTQLARHPVRGEQAFAAVPEFEEMASWVRWHHERPDGRGYPDKLRAPWIPLEAKILAVAQAYAAMVLDGPRRPGLGPAEARARLCAGVDAEFDGMVTRAFLRILDTESDGYRMADDHRFVFPVPGDRGRTRSEVSADGPQAKGAALGGGTPGNGRVEPK